jgi:hypothetical protein
VAVLRVTANATRAARITVSKIPIEPPPPELPSIPRAAVSADEPVGALAAPDVMVSVACVETAALSAWVLWQMRPNV